MKLSDAAIQAGMNPSDAIVVHRRPAVIQELDWRPRSLKLTNPPQADPVEDGMLYFSMKSFSESWSHTIATKLKG
jgi:hypothetical protein